MADGAAAWGGGDGRRGQGGRASESPDSESRGRDCARPCHRWPEGPRPFDTGPDSPSIRVISVCVARRRPGCSMTRVLRAGPARQPRPARYGPCVPGGGGARRQASPAAVRARTGAAAAERQDGSACPLHPSRSSPSSAAATPAGAAEGGGEGGGRVTGRGRGSRRAAFAAARPRSRPPASESDLAIATVAS